MYVCVCICVAVHFCACYVHACRCVCMGKKLLHLFLCACTCSKKTNHFSFCVIKEWKYEEGDLLLARITVKDVSRVHFPLVEARTGMHIRQDDVIFTSKLHFMTYILVINYVVGTMYIY